jgi:trehalose-phosphatase
METIASPSSIHPGSKLGRAVGARQILVATDFGGTVCARQDGFRPEAPHPEVLRALERLAAIPGVHLAVVSGRGAGGLATACADLPACWKISDHGRACADPKGRSLSDWPSNAGTGPLLRTHLEAESLFHGTGAHIELKRFSVLVRFESADKIHPEATARWCALARSFGLELVQGRGFLEALVPGFDKRRALVRLAAHLRCDFRVFGGDDGHDLPALTEHAARPDGMAVFVRSPERPTAGIRVDGTVDGVEGWAAWLSEFAGFLESRAA